MLNVLNGIISKLEVFDLCKVVQKQHLQPRVPALATLVADQSIFNAIMLLYNIYMEKRKLRVRLFYP